jgi:hypothetical protein
LTDDSAAPSLGRLVLRVLLGGWIVSVVGAAAAFGTGRLDVALPLAGLVGASAAALLVTPALLFLMYGFRHPPAEIPREMRRSAVESGAALLVVGALVALTFNALKMGPLFVAPLAALAVLGVVVAARAFTLGPPGVPLPITPRLRHRGATIAGALTLLFFAVLAPKALGGGSQPGQPTEANMRVDLRSLVAQQDGFFADHHRYASLADLGEAFRPSLSHADVVVAAESTRFLATATSPGTRLTCLVWTGTPVPPADSVHGAEDGVPMCWKR